MTDQTPPPAAPTTIIPQPERDGRPGFIADLGFTLVVPWLVLWRYELPGGPVRSMWTGWWPVIIVVGLLFAALAIGAAQRRPRGFLPYNVRWALLGATLVLPAWIAVSLADLGNRTVTFDAAAGDLRPTLQDRLADASTQDKEQVRNALDAVAASERLAEVVGSVEQAGKLLPAAKLPELSPEAAVDPTTTKTLAQAIGIADAIENGQPLPPEFAKEADAAGLDDAKILAALLVVAAAFLAPLLGLSTEITLMLVQALVAEGAITVGNVLRVAMALATSTTPGGNFDEAKIRDNFDRYGELAQSADILLDAARKHGADATTAPLGRLLAGKARNAGELRKRCRASLGDDAPKLSAIELKALLRKRCQYLDPDQIADEVADILGGKR